MAWSVRIPDEVADRASVDCRIWRLRRRGRPVPCEAAVILALLIDPETHIILAAVDVVADQATEGAVDRVLDTGNRVEKELGGVIGTLIRALRRPVLVYIVVVGEPVGHDLVLTDGRQKASMVILVDDRLPGERPAAGWPTRSLEKLLLRDALRDRRCYRRGRERDGLTRNAAWRNAVRREFLVYKFRRKVVVVAISGLVIELGCRIRRERERRAW